MKTISYYISMVVILAATIFTGCTDDDEKSLVTSCRRTFYL